MSLEIENVKRAVREVLAEQRICNRLESIEVMLRGPSNDRNDNGIVGDVRELKQGAKNRKALWGLVATNAGLILTAMIWILKHVQ